MYKEYTSVNTVEKVSPSKKFNLFRNHNNNVDTKPPCDDTRLLLLPVT